VSSTGRDTSLLTQDERAWLAEVEAEWAATSPGEWYPHQGDDVYSMSALYVSADIGAGWSDIDRLWVVDSGPTMAAEAPEQADHAQVVAITLLQEPRLVDPEECEQNALFIAHAHQHIPHLLAVIKRLNDAIAACPDPHPAP